jgi:two-component system chemotaxis response regulator CheY
MATVLVIDDDDMIREVVRRALERAGHDVLEASEGSEGLSRLKASAVDLMIVDVMMPKKGGIETLMELRNSRPGMKTIVITGKVDTASASFKNLIHAFGVKRVFQKPFDLDELAAAVQAILEEG